MFPLIPVISRSQLCRSLLDPNYIQVPVHLLAAIYASSFPFRVHDPCLCVSGAYENPPVDALWNLVYSSILREIHTPKLAVLNHRCFIFNGFPKMGFLLLAIAHSFGHFLVQQLTWRIHWEYNWIAVAGVYHTGRKGSAGDYGG